jgi:plastocyanin domain-containing protein
MTLVINLLGLALIVLIVWWFWLWQPKQAAKSDGGVIEILVDQGVYTPARIEIPVGRSTTLRFLRKDPSPCAEQVLIDDLGISDELPVDKKRDLVVKPEKPGRYAFTCQMRMYRGELIAR